MLMWPSTCFKALMLRWEFSGEALSSLQCFEPRCGYMQRDLFKQAGENTWRAQVQPVGKEDRDKTDSCDVLKQCYSMFSRIYD